MAVLLLAGCSSDDASTASPTSLAPATGDEATTTATSATSSTADNGDTSPASPTASTSDPTAGPSTTGADNSATSASSSTTNPEQTLPGEAVDGFAHQGDLLLVVGVAHDDVLNVRQGPGTGFAVLTTLTPTASAVVASGSARMLQSSFWYGVQVGDGDGWVNARYVAFGGVVDDVTSTVVDSLGTRPQAESMTELGMIVANDRASTDVESDLIVVVAPTLGDLGEITIDVIGLADDAAYGVRLHVFGRPLEEGSGFGLASVEQTELCSRGVDEEQRCV